MVVLFGGYWWWQGNSSQTSATDTGIQTPPVTDTTAQPNPPTTSVDVGVNVGAAMSASVTYDGANFSPASVTIKKGGTVAWKNASGRMWVASAQHPAHTIYSGTSRSEHCPDTTNSTFDQCASAGDYSFTFNKVGTWKYHDHINASAFGSVTVVE